MPTFWVAGGGIKAKRVDLHFRCHMPVTSDYAIVKPTRSDMDGYTKQTRESTNFLNQNPLVFTPQNLLI